MATHVRDSAGLADELLQRLGRTVGDRATVSTVFGEPVERNGVTVIPVAKARFGFGGGGGEGSRAGDEQGSGSGGGGGAAVRPVGYLELKDGETQFRRITSPSDALVLSIAVSLAVLTLRKLVRS